jgi:excisionase family DNA binding protein
MSNPEDSLVYSVEEAGRLLGLSRNSAYEAAKRGELPTLTFGRRLVVPRVALMRLLDSANPRSAA